MRDGYTVASSSLRFVQAFISFTQQLFRSGSMLGEGRETNGQCHGVKGVLEMPNPDLHELVAQGVCALSGVFNRCLGKTVNSSPP